MSGPANPMLPKQLPLEVSLRDDATFDNFYVSRQGANRQIISSLKSQLGPMGEQLLFLWGRPGIGCSYLLQAACHYSENAGFSVRYLPLRDLMGYPPSSLFDSLAHLDLVCLDDLQVVVGNPEWEQALFHFFNGMRDSGKRLLVAANCGPHELPVQLPDLQSRLAWGLTFQLSPMSDEEKQAALQLRARNRGLELSDEVAQFILLRAPRHLDKLFRLLERLDEESLAEQRRLTIPFVKQVLNF